MSFQLYYVTLVPPVYNISYDKKTLIIIFIIDWRSIVISKQMSEMQ